MYHGPFYHVYTPTILVKPLKWTYHQNNLSNKFPKTTCKNSNGEEVPCVNDFKSQEITKIVFRNISDNEAQSNFQDRASSKYAMK